MKIVTKSTWEEMKTMWKTFESVFCSYILAHLLMDSNRLFKESKEAFSQALLVRVFKFLLQYKAYFY